MGAVAVIASMTWVALGESFRDDSLNATILLLIPLVTGTAGLLLMIEAARCGGRSTPRRGFPIQFPGRDVDRAD
jgi:hypothetical protein